MSMQVFANRSATARRSDITSSLPAHIPRSSSTVPGCRASCVQASPAQHWVAGIQHLRPASIVASGRARQQRSAIRHVLEQPDSAAASMTIPRAFLRIGVLGGVVAAAQLGPQAASAATPQTSSSAGAAPAATAVATAPPAAVNMVQAPGTTTATAVATQPQFFPLDESKATLKMVQIVFRHGARTPLTKQQDLWSRTGAVWDVCGCAYDPVPLKLTTTAGEPAPYNAHDAKQVAVVYPGGCHMGQLTHEGQLQARDLGRWLRQRYVHQLKLLPASYQEGLIQARTTNFQRTIATLAGVLTGLLGEPAGLPGPIPAVTSTDLDEILYADTKQCPHLGIYMRLGKQVAKELIEADPEYQWACKELQQLGYLAPDQIAATTEWFFADLHDVVTSLAAAGKPIPKGFTPRLVTAINRLATKEFAPLIAPSVRDPHGHIMLRLSMGVLLHTLVTNMESAVGDPSANPSGNPSTNGHAQGTPFLSLPASDAAAAAASAAPDVFGAHSSSDLHSNKQPLIYMYSGHDSTIMPLLSALGHDVTQSWPPYLSNLVFELWQLPADGEGHGEGAGQQGEGPSASQPQHVVRVLYNREELQVPDCPPGMLPALDTFKSETIGPFLISQAALAEACKVPIEHDSSLPQVGGSMSSPGGAADE